MPDLAARTGADVQVRNLAGQVVALGGANITYSVRGLVEDVHDNDPNCADTDLSGLESNINGAEGGVLTFDRNIGLNHANESHALIWPVKADFTRPYPEPTIPAGEWAPQTLADDGPQECGSRKDT